MKKRPGRRNAFDPPEFAGTTVMGERGQVVIPKDVREKLKLAPGAKLVVVRLPHGPIALVPMDLMRDVVETMAKRLGMLSKKLA